MIEEAYVSFEVAKLLKEKGFEIDTSKDYWKIGEDGTMYFISSIGAYTSDINNKFAFYRPADTYPCPTQQMAMRWLREKHNIGVFPTTYYRKTKEHEGHNYGCDLVDLNAYEVIGDFKLTTFPSDSYEQSAEAAIKYCLENLIKK